MGLLRRPELGGGGVSGMACASGLPGGGCAWPVWVQRQTCAAGPGHASWRGGRWSSAPVRRAGQRSQSQVGWCRVLSPSIICVLLGGTDSIVLACRPSLHLTQLTGTCMLWLAPVHGRRSSLYAHKHCSGPAVCAPADCVLHRPISCSSVLTGPVRLLADLRVSCR